MWPTNSTVHPWCRTLEVALGYQWMLRRALLGGGGLAIALGILHRLSITQSNQPRCLCGVGGRRRLGECVDQ